MEPRRHITPEISLLIDPVSGIPQAVSSTFPVDTWKPRQPAAIGQLQHPGTALRIGADLFEITDARADAARPTTTVYDLGPWPESSTVRVADEVSGPACRAAAQRYREAMERLRRGKMLRPFGVLIGMLPAEDQQRFERDYGVAVRPSMIFSALVLMAAAVFCLVAGFAASRGHDFGSWTRFIMRLWDWKPLFLYLFVESLFRFVSSMGSDDPVGSLFVAGPINVFRAFRDAFRGAGKAPPPMTDHAFSKVRDTVRPWPGPEADVEILSRLPKDHWTVNNTTVVYQGVDYQLVDRQMLSEGVERHRFLLQVPDRDILQRYTFEYEPEEVREIYRTQKRHQSATWVETFALAWGWLDHDRQERLGRSYNYNPDKMTRRSIFFNVLVGGLAATQGFIRMREFGGLINVLEFAAGFALLWECGVRWGHWRAGRWRPSVLGVLSRPTADRFLLWEK